MSKLNVRYKFIKFGFIFLALNVSFSYEFDEKALEALGFGSVDLSAFSGENPVNDGEYRSQIHINNELILRDADIRFFQKEGGEDLCFSKEVLEQLPIKQHYMSNKALSFEDESEACYGFSEIDSSITIDFNGLTNDLKLTIPHIYLDRYDAQWVAPAQRDNGISGLVLDYTILQNYSKYRGFNSSKDLFSYGSAGANIGAFRFRGHYQYSRVTNVGQTSSNFQWDQVYGFVDIPSWSARLHFGELYSNSNTFTNVRFKGVSLATDENMMPSFMRGYAPQITGTVFTDAKITISQGSRVIRAIQAPAGQFEISDLPSNLNGLVEVKIEESDGSVRSYETEISQVPFLTRKGDVRYYLNAGKLSPKKHRGYTEAGRVTSSFSASEFSYGLTNKVSIYGGLATVANDYHAVNLGVGVDLGGLGAFSGDITRSSAKFGDKNGLNNMKGVAYRFNYAKKLNDNLNLNLVGYRFSTREYLTIDNYINLQSGHGNVDREKNRLMATISHQFVNDNSSISLNYERGSYWNRHNSSNLNIGYSKRIRSGWLRDSQLYVSVMRRTQSTGPKENAVSMFLSIPLEERTASVRYNITYADIDKSIDQNVTYYKSKEWGSYQVGVESHFRQSNQSDYGVTGSILKNSQYGSFRLSAREARDTRYFSAEADGSITVTSKGIVAHKQVYNDESRLIVDTGVSGVKLMNNRDQVSNYFGLIGVSDLSSYYNMQYRVDNDNLPEDVEIQNSVIDLAVSKGSIAYRNLNAISGKKAVAIITLEDGSHPPFGARILRENGEDIEVGLVSQDGLTYLTGLNRRAKFVVSWGGNQQCVIQISASFDANEVQNLICNME